MKQSEKLLHNARNLAQLVKDFTGKELEHEEACYIINESYLIERMNYRDFYYDNDENRYNETESGRREARLLYRINKLNDRINKYGLKIQFYGLPAHIEINNGSYYIDTYCTL